MSAPLITVFVRHSPGCPYKGDEFCKRCNCRKHLRWSQGGKQYRKSAGSRSWQGAEETKRQIEDQLAGRVATVSPAEGMPLAEALKSFLSYKTVQAGKEPDRYAREIGRLNTFLTGRGVFTVQGITRELLTDYMGTWAETYPSSYSRVIVRARLRCYLRYCYQSQWLIRMPDLASIKSEETPTLPLTEAEYAALLAAVPVTFPLPKEAAKVRALVRLMRHTGLALGDALKLPKGALTEDTGKKIYRVMTHRQKTGTHVSVPVPADLAAELLAVLNGNPEYFFITGTDKADSPRTVWARKYIRPLFEAAKISGDGWMKSHRLRDTFAVDLLQKGVPLEEVSKLLGHESIKTTETHYAKWVKGRQDRLDDLVTATWETK